MTFEDICKKIELPFEVSKAVNRYYKEIKFADLSVEVKSLYYRESWEEAISHIKTKLSDDEKGFKLLTVLLKCALYTYDKYQKIGIEDKIFYDTMKFCTRFIEEHKKVYGDYAFTWGWWFPRQLSMQEFRIGSLEFEFVEKEGKKIFIHIPSDASLSADAVKESLNQYQFFIRKFFPEWSDVDFYCESWLLSPVLKEMLDEDSNIINFQNMFEIVNVDYNSMAVLDWVFPGCKNDIEALPEITSLQGNMKRFLLEGKKVGWATGIYKK